MTEPDSWDLAAQARTSDRWAKAAARWNTAMTDALLSLANLEPDSVVLDLAAGSGDPALTIAARLKTGKVVALDSSGRSLLLAKAHAQRLGYATKITYLQADAEAIPLEQGWMDRSTCRCGIMFFHNTGLVTSEILRVLKPGGRAVFLVWGSFRQPFFDATVAIVLRLLRGAQLPLQARAMFRFAVPGSLEQVLQAAGFRDVCEEALTVPRIWSGTPDELWEYQQEISTLCHPLFDSIPRGMREKVDAEVSTALSQFQSGNLVSIPVNIIIASGRRS